MVLTGSVAILLCFAAAHAIFPALPALRIALVLLLVWNLALPARTALGKNNWIVAVSGDRVLLKLFVPRGARQSAEVEENVVEVPAEDVGSLSSLTIDLTWPRSNPSAVEWLVVDPSSASRTSFERWVKPLFPSSLQCDPRKEWFAGWKDAKLLVRWELFRPSLPEFLGLVRLHKPIFTIAEGQRSSLDLRTFWSRPEHEQRELLMKAKRLGFGPTCVLLLKQYRRMSANESLSYLADAEDKKSGDRGTRLVSVQASGLLGTVEYESMHFSGILVEEYSSDWKEQLAQVKTDNEGGFALPRTSCDGTHYIQISWPGTQAVRLRVEIAQNARPLLVRLRPQARHGWGNR